MQKLTIKILKDYPEYGLKKDQEIEVPSSFGDGITIRQPMTTDNKYILWVKKSDGSINNFEENKDYSVIKKENIKMNEQGKSTQELAKEATDSYYSTHKFSSAGAVLGFVYGLYYANKNGKHGFWTYVGHGIMFGAVGSASGIVIDKLMEKK